MDSPASAITATDEDAGEDADNRAGGKSVS
jgi:hypothetical protein